MDEKEAITWIALLVPLVHLTGFLNAGHAIMRARTPQGSLGWAVALVSFPYLAIPAYWAFGSSGFKAYAAKLRELEAAYKKQIHHIAVVVRPFAAYMAQDRWGTQAFLHRMTHWPLTGHNDVRLLIDGQATFDAILSAISQAQSYVAIEFYIMRDDTLGQRLKTVLCERARAGIHVYLLCDSIGSYYLGREYFRDLSDAGVDCRFFTSSKGWLPARFHLNFRNHRKIVVIDGREAFVGGLNVGDEYLGKDRYFGHWRDTHLTVRGPAVQGVQIAYAKDWYWMAGEIPDFNWEPEPTEGSAEVLSLETGPDSE
ncbi:phospholipase D-like domain-containing protein, partial [Planctomycetota bacterium]